jgi:heptose I phosphotransferase
VWVAPAHADRIPADLDRTVMEIQSNDRLHEKQGRSTARVRLDGPGGSVTAYLKRHHRLPWFDRLGALLFPAGRFSPGAAEWSNLRWAEQLGVPVPAALAAGERIGPGIHLQSYLLVRELADCLELQEALPRSQNVLTREAFARWKRATVRRMAGIVARLHAARLFHKDLYLCHFFVPADPESSAGTAVTLIDLHRLRRHAWTAGRWRLKDLGQLLYSTAGVAGLDDRDRLRFWMHYRRALSLGSERVWRRAIVVKAGGYRRHNRS